MFSGPSSIFCFAPEELKKHIALQERSLVSFMSFILYSYGGKYFTHVSEQINSAAPKDTNKENKTIKKRF